MNEDTIDLANSISLKQMADLIQIFSDRIGVYVGKAKDIQEYCSTPVGNEYRTLVESDLNKDVPVVMNGATIQLNLEFTDFNSN